MPRSHPMLSLSHRWQRWLLLAGVAGLALWLAFFDSYSMAKRIGWHHEAATLQVENARLQAEAERLETTLDAGLTDEAVEEIAREQYGMRRPGETVYPIDEE